MRLRTAKGIIAECIVEGWEINCSSYGMEWNSTIIDPKGNEWGIIVDDYSISPVRFRGSVGGFKKHIARRLRRVRADYQLKHNLTPIRLKDLA